MENFNRTISFILGLVVVIVFLAIVSGRLNLKNIGSSLTKKNIAASPTITPTPGQKKSFFSFLSRPSATPTIRPLVKNKLTLTPMPTSTYQTYGTGAQGVQKIPNTGVPTIFLPFAISTLAGGLYLRKKK